ncbi:MAG: hypothetical protein ACKOUS_03705, partial [Alphaproteobacteria bacterium]
RLMDAVSRTVFRTSLLSGVAQGIGAGFMQVTSFAVAAAGSLLVLSEDLTIGGLAACTMLARGWLRSRAAGRRPRGGRG